MLDGDCYKSREEEKSEAKQKIGRGIIGRELIKLNNVRKCKKLRKKN